jgi:hypothetical protein
VRRPWPRRLFPFEVAPARHWLLAAHGGRRSINSRSCPAQKQFAAHGLQTSSGCASTQTLSCLIMGILLPSSGFRDSLAGTSHAFSQPFGDLGVYFGVSGSSAQSVLPFGLMTARKGRKWQAGWPKRPCLAKTRSFTSALRITRFGSTSCILRASARLVSSTLLDWFRRSTPDAFPTMGRPNTVVGSRPFSP